jgi:structural maintenance of chromosome 3 (chondroitin sulfate proteoglycan 6)
MDDLKRKRDDLKTREAILEQTVQDGAKDLEQLMNSRSTYLAKQEECMKKIRDLGSLPADAFEAYCIHSLHYLYLFMALDVSL